MKLKKIALLALGMGIAGSGFSAVTVDTGAASAASAAGITAQAAEAIKNKQDEGMLSYFWADKFSQLATIPSFSLAAQSGLVPSWGVIYGAGSGVTNVPSTNGTDASIAVGMGFGDASDFLGGGLSLGIGSVNPKDSGIGGRGNINISLGHFFSKTLTGVAIGEDSIGGWNNGGGNPTGSYYAAVTQILPNDIAPVILNAGIGNNIYTFIRSTKHKTTSVGVFGSVAVYVLPQLAVVADNTSGVTTAGVSLVPFVKLPITVNLAAWDVFSSVQNHPNVSFLGSISYAYTF
ncbi:MAG: hypothetical protein ACO2ZM_06585 [Francisellaceae bacterium]